MSKSFVIDYYSDVLCVWAWVAQRRLDELNKLFGDRIELHYHYIDVFGDSAGKIEKQWGDRGGYKGFSEHVIESAASFENAPVNPKVWDEIRPATSANAHKVLKAVELAYDKQSAINLALVFRKAFFVDAKDIGHLDVLCDLVKQEGIDPEGVRQSVNEGTAIAALMSDYQKATQLALKGSPSYVMDGGRQTLYGNVGYRVLHANIEELLKNPVDEASWC